MILLAAALLEVGLLSHDFSLAYVTEHSDLSTPTPLVAAAFYGGQEGSLLYWALVLGLLGSASWSQARRWGCALPPTPPGSWPQSRASCWWCW